MMIMMMMMMMMIIIIINIIIMEAKTTYFSPEDSWFDSPRTNRFISSAKRPDLLCCQHGLVYDEYPGVKWPRREADHFLYLRTRFKTGTAARPTHTP